MSPKEEQGAFGGPPVLFLPEDVPRKHYDILYTRGVVRLLMGWLATLGERSFRCVKVLELTDSPIHPFGTLRVYLVCTNMV